MTTTSVPEPHPSAAPEPTRGRNPRGPGHPVAWLPAAAGVGYLVAWVAGLAAWPANLPLNATAAQTTASYAAHPTQAVVQYLLVEGLAGLLLGIVLGCAVVPRLRGGNAVRARAAVASGTVAVGISLAQCVLGLVLTSAATGHDVSRCGDLSDLVNRLDGVKMLALAVVAALLAAPGSRTAAPGGQAAAPGGRPLALPRWLRVVAVPLGVSLIASGYAYLALSQPLAWTAYISGTLLLLWVTGLGLAQTYGVRSSSRPAPR